jgi:hypothetical protein
MLLDSREPPEVEGDGWCTVRTLVERANAMRCHAGLAPIAIDGALDVVGGAQGLALDAVPPHGMRVVLVAPRTLTTAGRIIASFAGGSGKRAARALVMAVCVAAFVMGDRFGARHSASECGRGKTGLSLVKWAAYTGMCGAAAAVVLIALLAVPRWARARVGFPSWRSLSRWPHSFRRSSCCSRRRAVPADPRRHHRSVRTPAVFNALMPIR